MRALIVVPCYNEAQRLPAACVARLLDDVRIDILLVDDGSQDATATVLASLAQAHPGRVRVLPMGLNVGKAEAVRRGLLDALELADIVGFADADFATPPRELSRLLDELLASGAELVLGSRVLRLGATIDRSPARHLAGRAFATVAAMAVGAGVYDTQCGAKWFRVTPALRAALATPFTSRWAFDVELLCRLFGRHETAVATNPGAALEVPLREWRDVEGSKLDIGSMAKSFGELLGIWLRAERHGRSLSRRRR